MTPFDGLGLIVGSNAVSDVLLHAISAAPHLRLPGRMSPTPAVPFNTRPRIRRSAPYTANERSRLRRGATLVEQLWLLVLIGGLAALALTSGASLFAALDVAMAAQETVNLLALARDHAIATGDRTAVRFDVVATRVVVHAGRDTIAVGDFHGSGLTLEATRDSLSYAPSGLGVGAANLRLVLTRSARADTITVSRLGRVQRR